MAQTHMTAAALRDEIAASTVDARRLIGALFDEGTFLETGTYRKNGEGCFEGVVTGFGAVDGRPVFAFVQDYANGRAALTAVQAQKIASLYEMALKAGAPMVGVFAGAGAKLTEGIDCLSAYGLLLTKAQQAKNRIPQVAVIAGDCGGASAVFAEAFDFTVADAKTGERYLLPSVDKKADQKADLFAEGVEELAAKTRLLLNHLPSNSTEGGVCGLFNEQVNAAADMAAAAQDGDAVALLQLLADDGQPLLLGETKAPEMVCGFLMLGGRVIGAVGNQPKENGGRLTCGAAKKATRFLDFCCRFGVPVLTLVNTEGLGDKACGCYAEALLALASCYGKEGTAKVTVIVGKAYGAAFTYFGAKSVGADLVFALDDAVISVLPPETAVEFVWDDRVKAAADPKEAREALKAEWIATQASPLMAARSGDVDDIVASDELKQRIAAAFEMLA